MSRVTKHVGFGLTYSSTFMHPYYLARLMNSLDHVTGGRIAMNLVTSTRRSDAANFGFDELMEHDARYDRMEEFIDVCRQLWDSDRARTRCCGTTRPGGVGDPAKVHGVSHRRPLLQGRGAAEHAALAAGPAGADPGRRLAARHPRLRLCRRQGVRRRHAARLCRCKQRAALDAALIGAGARSGKRRHPVADADRGAPRPSARRRRSASGC